MDPQLQAMLAQLLSSTGGAAGGGSSMTPSMVDRPSTQPLKGIFDSPQSKPTLGHPGGGGPGPVTIPEPPPMAGVAFPGLGGRLTGPNPVITPMFRHLFDPALVQQFGVRQANMMPIPTFDGKQLHWNVATQKKWWMPGDPTVITNGPPGAGGTGKNKGVGSGNNSNNRNDSPSRRDHP